MEDTLPPLRELLQRHGFRFSKSMGQNFLVNPGVCPRMASACGATKAHGVLEIGPGAGALTRELAKVAGRVAAVELDTRLLPVLAESLADFDNVEVIHGDILKLDLRALLAERFPGMPVAVCANLPYYITTPVLMRLLEERLPIESVTVMVQQEAAARLCAPMGSRECGAVTAAVAWFAQAEQLFKVSRGSFLPVPNVDSAVIRLRLRREPPMRVADEAFLFKVIRVAFCQRRKTLANALSAGLRMGKANVLAALENAGIAPNARAEELTMEEFAGVTEALILL